MKRGIRLFTVLMILALVLEYMPAHMADEAFAAADSGQWQKAGSGTQYYAEFPSGYYKSSSLYGKYNNSKLSPYENADSKRVISTTRVSYIYWHWTWNASVSTEQNNKLIDDKQGYDGQHDYQYFTDFESAEEYPVWSGDNRVYEYWRNRPEDGSRWWFRIPIYKQTYTDYKYVSSDDNSDKTNNNSNKSNSNANKNTSAKNSNKNSVKKNTPKKTSVNKCRPKKKSCSLGWKKCSGKCTGYQIRYCTNKNFKGCKTKRIKGRNTCSCSLTGLKAGTIYYYQIRCYKVVGKKTYCSRWSKCKSFKTIKNKSKKTSKKKSKRTAKKDKYKNSSGNVYRTIDYDWGDWGFGTYEFPKVKAGGKWVGLEYRSGKTIIWYKKSKNGKKTIIKKLKENNTSGSPTRDTYRVNLTNGTYTFYTHYHYEGFENDDWLGHEPEYASVYRTDNSGRTIKVFEIDRRIELIGLYKNKIYFLYESSKSGDSGGFDAIVYYDLGKKEFKTVKRTNNSLYSGRNSYGRHAQMYRVGVKMNIYLYDMATNKIKSLPVKNANYVYLAPDGIYCQKDKKIYRCRYNGKTKKVLLKGYVLHRMDDENIYVFKDRKKAKITDEYRYNIRTKKLKRIGSYNNDI